MVKNTRKKGGSVQSLPGVTEYMTLEAFEYKWDVFYITAHGGITDDIITVPNNTYILNTAPTTESCRLHPDLARFGILYKNKRKSVTSYTENFMNYITNPKDIAPFLYNLTNIMNYDPASNYIPLVTSIYESDDTILDMKFTFSSHVVPNENQAKMGISHFVVPGIFKIPISYKAKRLRNKLLRNTRKKIKDKLETSIIEDALSKADSKFLKLKENLVNKIKKEFGIVGNKILLSNILNSTYLQPSKGKKRLILIHACKKFEYTHTNQNKQIQRRYSLSRILTSELKHQEEEKQKEINENEWGVARLLALPKIEEKTNKELEEEAAEEEAKRIAKEAENAEKASLVAAAAAAKRAAKKVTKKPTLANLLKEEGINV